MPPGNTSWTRKDPHFSSDLPDSGFQNSPLPPCSGSRPPPPTHRPDAHYAPNLGPLCTSCRESESRLDIKLIKLSMTQAFVGGGSSQQSQVSLGRPRSTESLGPVFFQHCYVLPPPPLYPAGPSSLQRDISPSVPFCLLCFLYFHHPHISLQGRQCPSLV